MMIVFCIMKKQNKKNFPVHTTHRHFKVCMYDVVKYVSSFYPLWTIKKKAHTKKAAYIEFVPRVEAKQKKRK